MPKHFVNGMEADLNKSVFTITRTRGGMNAIGNNCSISVFADKTIGTDGTFIIEHTGGSYSIYKGGNILECGLVPEGSTVVITCNNKKYSVKYE
jgi:hypothetical protein